MIPLNSPTRTLVADDGESLLTNLGALRRACAGHELRDDMARFLDQLKGFPDELAVYVDADGPKIVRDEEDNLLQWVKAERRQ